MYLFSWVHADFVWIFSFSAKPQEYKARLEKQHEAKKEVLGHSKQAEFVRFMEQEVEYQLGSDLTQRPEIIETKQTHLFETTFIEMCLLVGLWFSCETAGRQSLSELALGCPGWS